MPKHDPFDFRSLAKSLEGFNSVARQLADQMRGFQGQSVLQSLQPTLQSISKLQESSGFRNLTQSIIAVQQQLEKSGYSSSLARIQESLSQNPGFLAWIDASGLASIQNHLKDIGEKYASLASTVRLPAYAISLERGLPPAIRTIQVAVHNAPQSVQAEVSVASGELAAWDWQPFLEQLKTISTQDLVKLLNFLWQVALAYIAVAGYFGATASETRERQMLQNDSHATEERQQIISILHGIEDAQQLGEDFLKQLQDSISAIHETQNAIFTELSNRQICVISRRVGLHPEPQQRKSVLMMMSRNQQVDVIEAQGEWRKIQFQDTADGTSYEGWVKAQYVESKAIK